MMIVVLSLSHRRASTKPVGNVRPALTYLTPYVFRVAISHRRLVKLENDQVTFRYRAMDTGQLRLRFGLMVRRSVPKFRLSFFSPHQSLNR